MKLLIYLNIFSFFSLVVCQSVLADDKRDVGNLVKEKIEFVLETLQDKNLDKKTKTDRIIAKVTPILDFERMAKLSLGKKHWTNISQEKQKEFTEVFVKRTQQSYLERLELYSNETVNYKEATQVKKRIYVMTELVYKGDKIEMLYKFYKSKKGWKGYDIEILGVSIIQTYRSQFNGVIKKEGIDGLLAKLRTSGGFEISAEKK